MGRRYIRHPTDIPIDYRIIPARDSRRESMRNLSAGGLCFRAASRLRPGTDVDICIGVCEPVFEAEATVVWCNRSAGGYDVGVRFRESASLFAVRMVEQVCHIEQYRKDIWDRERRRISSEQAAAEWINKHAEEFPQL